MPRLHTYAWGVVLAALAASQICGCQSGNDCHIPEARCDGDVALNCKIAVDVKGKDTIFNETECAGSCQVDSQGAFCAVTSKPAPICNGGSNPVCDGSVVTQCRNGYASSTLDCVSKTRVGIPDSIIPASAGAFCVTSDALAFCALEADPLQVCKGARYGAPSWQCDGDDRVECFDGYVLQRTSCGSGHCSESSREGKCT